MSSLSLCISYMETLKIYYLVCIVCPNYSTLSKTIWLIMLLYTITSYLTNGCSMNESLCSNLVNWRLWLPRWSQFILYLVFCFSCSLQTFPGLLSFPVNLALKSCKKSEVLLAIYSYSLVLIWVWRYTHCDNVHSHAPIKSKRTRHHCVVSYQKTSFHYFIFVRARLFVKHTHLSSCYRTPCLQNHQSVPDSVLGFDTEMSGNQKLLT